MASHRSKVGVAWRLPWALAKKKIIIPACTLICIWTLPAAQSSLPAQTSDPIGQVRQALRSTLTESTANDRTSGIPPEISLGIHHKGPDLSLNSITPLSTCEMRPGWIWSFLLWLVDETMWEISPENWEGFTRAPQPPALQHGYLLFGCLSPELSSCRRGEGRLGTSLPHVNPSSKRARAERGCPAPGAPRPPHPLTSPGPGPGPGPGAAG